MDRAYILQFDPALAQRELAAAEAALSDVRRRFDAVLTPEALVGDRRDEQQALSRAVLAAELRAAAARRGVEVALSALEMFKVAKAA